MNKSILEQRFFMFLSIFLPSKQFQESLQLAFKLTPFSHQILYSFLFQSLRIQFNRILRLFIWSTREDRVDETK